MSQDFQEFPASEKKRDSRPKIAARDEALRSKFSGTAFPTDPEPVPGQDCFRTDEKKLYQLIDDYWVELPLFIAQQTIAALRSLYAAEVVASGTVVQVLGASALGDCPPFYVKWAPASSAADDGATVFRPTNGAAVSGNGRWLRINVNPSRTFTNSDATPSIANGEFYVTAGTPPAAITDFDDAFEGQEFTIQRGSADCTITHDPTKIDLGGQDLTLTATAPRARFIHVNGIHRLLGGSVTRAALEVAPTHDISHYAAGDGWTAAMNRAFAALNALGGGALTWYGQEDYTLLTDPDEVPANVVNIGRPNFTRIFLPTGAVDCTVFKYTGALGASYTLASNASSGAEKIVLSSVAGLTVGKRLYITRTVPSQTLGLYRQMPRIRRIDAGTKTVWFVERLDFSVFTSDTYTINLMDSHAGGGVMGFIFDGSNNTGLECIGVSALYVERLLLGNLHGEQMHGGDPENTSTQAALCMLWGVPDLVVNGPLSTYRSGCVGVADMQFKAMGPAHYPSIKSEWARGFGPCWYDSPRQHVGSLISIGAHWRAGKAQCCPNFQIDMLESENTYGATGFAFPQGTTAHVNEAVYSRNQAPDAISVTSIVRASNVATITLTEDPLIGSAHQMTIAGATGANDFNGTVVLTRVSSLVYTYPNTGTNETAGGTITATMIANPSLWLDDEASKVFIGRVRFKGATNPAGDIHVGSSDQLEIGKVTSESGTVTMGGTGVVGTNIRIANKDGVLRLDGVIENDVIIGSGSTNGQFCVRATGKRAGAFFMDNNHYLLIAGNAATSGTTGFLIQVKDSAGVARNAYFTNAAGAVRLVNDDPVGHIQLWTNNTAYVQLENTGNFHPLVDDTSELGKTSFGWKNLWIAAAGKVKIGGTNVVGARKTGWSVDTGTADRGAHATYTAPTISASPTQTEVQNIANALQDVSRAMKALKDDLHGTAGHGLIGT